jgi:hypothetical protein
VQASQIVIFHRAKRTNMPSLRVHLIEASSLLGADLGGMNLIQMKHANEHKTDR